MRLDELCDVPEFMRFEALAPFNTFSMCPGGMKHIRDVQLLEGVF